MRLDKYLKVTRILKRRTVGKELAKNQRILINERIAKPATEINVNDIIEVIFGNRHLKIRVLSVQQYSKKEDANMLYEVVNEFTQE